MSTSGPPRTTPPERSAAVVSDDDRPTVTPEFDVEAFARDSEIRQRAAMAIAEDEPTIDQARRLHADHQHEQALFVLNRVLEIAPLHPDAKRLSVECRAALEEECLNAIGSEATILVLAVTSDQLKGFALDHVSGFLLSLADGTLAVEAILDVSGLPRLLALRHLRSLVDLGLLSVA